MTPRKLVPSFRKLVGFLSGFCFLSLALGAAEPAKRSFDLPAGNADLALKRLAEQSGREVLFPADAVEGIQTKAVKGEMTPQEALDAMLAGTPLVGVQDAKTGSLTVRREASVEKAEKNGSSRPGSDRAAGDKAEGPLKLETFEVMGTKLLNMDIRRTRDDAQPYVIFDRALVEQSGAFDLGSFLQKRLPMNTGTDVNSRNASNTLSESSASEIGLRGLGAGQTLMLVDGHRIAELSLATVSNPPDINFIPPAAVERIEVLPATASGIYGGSATGGVINIILRRDYSGGEIKLTYDNTFHSDSARRRVDLAQSLSFNGGKTTVLLAGSYYSANQLWVQDRTFYQRGLATVMRNNPAAILGLAMPPIGATTNIRSTDGSNLVLKDGTPLNSPYTSVPAGYAGAAADGGAALVARAGGYNLNLAPTAQFSQGGRESLLAAPERASLMFTARHQINPSVQLFLEGDLSNNEADSALSLLYSRFVSYTLDPSLPGNPFTKSVNVTFPTALADGTNHTAMHDRRAVGGIIVKLPGDWKAEADYTWERVTFKYHWPLGLPAAGQTAIRTGAINVLRDTLAFPVTEVLPYLVTYDEQPGAPSTLQDVSLRVGGGVWNLPAGKVSLNGLLEYRNTDQPKSGENVPVSNLVAFYPARKLRVGSGYLELNAPLVAAAQHVPFVQSLDLQLAGRYDKYRTWTSGSSLNFGPPGTVPPPDTPASNTVSSVNPTVALRYAAGKDLVLRASYGTGFFSPPPERLLPSPGGSALITDPRRPGAPAYIAPNGILGGNPNLGPEHSKSTSIGAVLTPRFLPGLRLSLDYTRILKTDNITTLTAQQLVDNEALFPSRITRGPNLPGDQAGWAGPIIGYDVTSVNLARAEVYAYDLQLDYSRDLGALGKIDFFALSTWQTHYRTQLIATAPVVENVGRSRSFPLKFKGNAGVTLTRGRWRGGWTTSYFDHYLVADPASAAAPGIYLSQGSRVIPPQVYHDLFISYRVPGNGRGWRTLLQGTEWQLGIQNVFDTKPPFDASAAPGTTVNYYISPFGDVRGVSYRLSVKRAF